MDKVTRKCPQTTTFLKRKESQSGIQLRSFSGRTNISLFFKQAKSRRTDEDISEIIYLASVCVRACVCVEGGGGGGGGGVGRARAYVCVHVRAHGVCVCVRMLCVRMCDANEGIYAYMPLGTFFF